MLIIVVINHFIPGYGSATSPWIPDKNRFLQGKVPEFVTWCIEHIERDLDTDGIYRVAANQATVHSLRLDVDQRVEKSKWKYGSDIHVICGALKVKIQFKSAKNRARAKVDQKDKTGQSFA